MNEAQTNGKMVSSSAVDLLLIEVVPLVERTVKELGNDPDTNQDDIYFRIEGYGYRVGRGLCELFTRERARFVDQLDIMKFICKELWVVLYKKQMDNLKTNHRGTFVLIDNNFKYCQRMSTAHGSADTLKKATPYLWFPVGIIRGVLSALGIEASVSFDSTEIPGVSFNVLTG
jgi:trafficking protein particle complex subunit 6